MDTPLSFADADKAGPVQTREAGTCKSRVDPPQRIMVHVDGRHWRSYTLYRAAQPLVCSHCCREIATGDQLISYGRSGWFWCCLRCIEHHHMEVHPC